MQELFGFDIDGVTANSYEVLSRKVEKKALVTFLNPMTYDPYKKLGNLNKEEFMQLFTEAVINDELHPMDGAIDVLREYYSKTKRLVFITHRNGNVLQETRAWIAKHFRVPYELYQCYKCEKALIAKDLGITGFIDDLPEVVLSFINHGFKAYLYDSPWHLYEDFESDLPTVKNWHDIRKVLL
jgi:uncharacterized HAD superfamily protein